MNWNKWVRQTHRWLAIVFTVTVVICLVALGLPEPAAWVFYVPLLPLVLMLVTGLNLFAMPYTSRWRGSRRNADQS